MFNPLSLIDQGLTVFKLIRSLVWHASLDLSFDADRTFHDAKRATHPGRTARYVHLICTNRSRVRAVGCSVHLMGVWQGTSRAHLATHPDFEGSILMRWAKTPESGPLANTPVDIDGNSTRRVDLGFTLNDDARFHLYLPPEYTGVPHTLDPGQYQFDVEVRAMNSRPRRVKRRFELIVEARGALTITRVDDGVRAGGGGRLSGAG